MINLNTIKNLLGMSQNMGIKIIMKSIELTQLNGKLIDELGSNTENRFDIIIFMHMGLM